MQYFDIYALTRIYLNISHTQISSHMFCTDLTIIITEIVSYVAGSVNLLQARSLHRPTNELGFITLIQTAK